MNLGIAALAALHWAERVQDPEMVALAITALGDHVLAKRAWRERTRS